MTGDRDIMIVKAQPGRRVTVQNALTGDVAGYVDVAHVPMPEALAIAEAQPAHDGWAAVQERVGERNGCALESCVHCTICHPELRP